MTLSLKGIPTWAKVTGGVGLLLILVLAYEWKQAGASEGTEGDPCDPEDPHYDKELCERLASGDTSQFPFRQGGQLPGTGAGGGGGWVGIQPYLPPGDTTTGHTLPEILPAENEVIAEAEPPEPPEPVHTVPAPFVVAEPLPVPHPPAPGGTPSIGQAVPVYTPHAGVGGATALPAPQPAPAPVQNTPIDSGGWCGHPNAVSTGNACVNGGVGSHTAPAGYHLFCCNGIIGRAPN